MCSELIILTVCLAETIRKFLWRGIFLYKDPHWGPTEDEFTVQNYKTHGETIHFEQEQKSVTETVIIDALGYTP